MCPVNWNRTSQGSTTDRRKQQQEQQDTTQTQQHGFESAKVQRENRTAQPETNGGDGRLREDYA